MVLYGADIMDAHSAMNEIASAGFDCFEYTHGHVTHLEDIGKSAFDDAVAHASSLGLDPVQLHGPSLERGFDLGSPDAQIRKKSVERCCLWIGHCVDLEVPVMVEHGCEFHDDFQATMALMKDSFGMISKCAGDHGVKVAIENEFDPRPLARAGDGRSMVIPARVGCLMSELLEVIRDVDPENLGVCLDFGHANLQRPIFKLEEAIRELGEYFIATHIHDNEGLSDQHMLPLMGGIDWEATVGALRETGYDGPLILEVGGLSSNNQTVRRNRLRLYRTAAREVFGVD